jgi:transcriptional regulator with GAF, ATPase, and Fis domain
MTTDALDQIDRLVAGVPGARGDGLFEAIVRCMGGVLGASRVLIGAADDGSSAHTLAVFADGAPQPNYRFPLEGTDCAEVLGGRIVQRETAQPDRRAYLGLPLKSDDGAVLGHLCASHEQTLPVSARQRLTCELLAALATAELQRRHSEQQFEEMLRRQMLLEARNRQLEEDLKLLEREQVTLAATGVHRTLSPVPPPIDLDDSVATGLHHVQREHILRVLNATRWVIEGNSGAALKLGMKPATLRHRMKKLGISRELRARHGESATR